MKIIKTSAIQTTGLLITEAALVILLSSCGGGGGGSSGGSTGETETPPPPAQTGVKSGELSHNSTDKKAFARPNNPLTMTVNNALCYQGNPAFEWYNNSIAINGATNQSLIVGKSFVGRSISAKINCTGSSLSLAPAYINAGDQYAIEELVNILQNPVPQNPTDPPGYGLTMERTGYSLENPFTGESIDVLGNSNPEIWGSVDNPNGNFSAFFYESLDQKVVNAKIKGAGCLKDAQGSYNANDCITIQEVIDFMTSQGITDVYSWPTEGKNFTELNKKSTDDLKAGNLISGLERKGNNKYAELKQAPDRNVYTKLNSYMRPLADFVGFVNKNYIHHKNNRFIRQAI